MKLVSIKLILLMILFVSISCNSISIAECECDKILIYGTTSGILTPIRISRNDVMKNEPKIITKKEAIKKLISEIQMLEKTETMEGIDNRFVIEVKCNNGQDFIIGSNNYITRIGSSYFKPSKEFLDFVSTHTRISKN